MSEQIGIDIVANDAQFQKAMAAFIEGLREGASEAEKTASKINQTTSHWRDLGDEIDRAGRQSRIGIRALTEVGGLAGFNMQMLQSIGIVANMTDAVGDLAGAFSAINPVMFATVAAGAAVTLMFQRQLEESKKSAEAIEKMVAPYKEAAQAIRSLVELKGIPFAAKELGVAPEMLEHLIKRSPEAAESTALLTEQLGALKVKEQELAKAVEELERIQVLAADPEYSQYVTRQQDEVARLQREYVELARNVELTRRELARQANQTVGMGAEAYYQRLKKQDQSFLNLQWENQRKYEQLAQQTAEQILRIESSLSDQRVKINASTAERIAGIQAQMTKTLGDIQRDWERQLQAFARQEVQINNDAAKAMAQAQRDANKQLARIERDTSKALLRVDEDLNKALRRARTARARRELREDARDRKRDILEQAIERRAAIEEQRQERLQQIEEQRRERLAQLAESKQLAQEETNYRKAEAKRVADEQIVQARRAADAQIAAAEDAARRQTAALQTELAKQRVAWLGTLNDMNNAAALMGATIGNTFGKSLLPALQTWFNVIRALPFGNIIPQFQRGGIMPYDGLAYLHAGERVIPASQHITHSRVVHYHFSHTWHAPISSETRSATERMVREVTHQELARVLGGV